MRAACQEQGNEPHCYDWTYYQNTRKGRYHVLQCHFLHKSCPGRDDHDCRGMSVRCFRMLVLNQLIYHELGTTQEHYGSVSSRIVMLSESDLSADIFSLRIEQL